MSEENGSSSSSLSSSSSSPTTPPTDCLLKCDNGGGNGGCQTQSNCCGGGGSGGAGTGGGAVGGAAGGGGVGSIGNFGPTFDVSPSNGNTRQYETYANTALGGFSMSYETQSVGSLSIGNHGPGFQTGYESYVDRSAGSDIFFMVPMSGGGTSNQAFPTDGSDCPCNDGGKFDEEPDPSSSTSSSSSSGYSSSTGGND